jgi:hypothetical protein
MTTSANKKKRTSDQPKTSAVIKRLYAKSGKKLSLKEFVRTLSDPVAKEWKDHKKGSLEKVAGKKRLETKGGRIALEKSATRLARRKSKGGSSTKTTV